MKLISAPLVLVGLSVMLGCSEAEPPEETVGNAEGAFITDNALTDNALTDNALEAIQDPSAQGALNRELLRYIVACAFRSHQSFEFSWTDANGVVHDEEYEGQLGLAPQWRTGRLNERGQRMVSACLASKVNYHGVHVTISVRSGESPLRLHPHDSELDDFPYVEGAFWGNLWASKPYLNACYNSINVNHSRQQLRECAAGHPLPNGTIDECGIINIVGSCNSVCKKYNTWRGHYEDCREKPGVSHKRTDLVITTALP